MSWPMRMLANRQQQIDLADQQVAAIERRVENLDVAIVALEGRLRVIEAARANDAFAFWRRVAEERTTEAIDYATQLQRAGITPERKT